MKKFLITVTTMAVTLSAPLAVEAQFQSATIVEDVYPPQIADIPKDVTHMCAHSYVGVLIDDTLKDLYVYTWDRGNDPNPNGGFAVREFQHGTDVENGAVVDYEEFNPAVFLNSDAASVDAVILYENNEPYIMLCYYDFSQSSFYLDLYKWEVIPGGGRSLIQDINYPQPLGQTLPVANPGFGWIHIDASYTHEEYMVSFDTDGKLYCAASAVSVTAPILFEPQPAFYINSSSFTGHGTSTHSDIAMSYSDADNAFLGYLVYHCPDGKRMWVSSVDYNTVFNNAIVGDTLVPNFEDLLVAKGDFGLPRIDAPDKFANKSWSAVVRDDSPGDNAHFIRSIISANNSTASYGLNNGSLGSLTDISEAYTANQTNGNPVVAFGNGDEGNSVYYCWPFFSSLYNPSPSSEAAYIGIRLRNDGALLGPSTDYWVAQDVTNQTAPIPAIGLSTANYGSTSLFMAFAQFDYGNDEAYCGNKTVDWTNTSFKPGFATGMGTLQLRDISLYPNPFYNSLQLKVTDNGEIINFELYDVLGRLHLALQGNVKVINRRLLSIGNDIPPGSYFAKITTANKCSTHSLVKQGQ